MAARRLTGRFQGSNEIKKCLMYILATAQLRIKEQVSMNSKYFLKLITRQFGYIICIVCQGEIGSVEISRELSDLLPEILTWHK